MQESSITSIDLLILSPPNLNNYNLVYILLMSYFLQVMIVIYQLLSATVELHPKSRTAEYDPFVKKDISSFCLQWCIQAIW